MATHCNKLETADLSKTDLSKALSMHQPAHAAHTRAGRRISNAMMRGGEMICCCSYSSAVAAVTVSCYNCIAVSCSVTHVTYRKCCSYSAAITV